MSAVSRLDSLPTTTIFEDNAAALKWCHNPVNHSKQKHIHVAFHFIREQITDFQNLNVVAVPTEHQWADLFTKSLPAPRFRFLVDSIRGLNPAPLTRGPGSKLTEHCAKALTTAARKVGDVFKKRQATSAANIFFKDHFEETDPVHNTAQAPAAA